MMGIEFLPEGSRRIRNESYLPRAGIIPGAAVATWNTLHSDNVMDVLDQVRSV